MQGLDGLVCAGLDGVGHRQNARKMAINGQMHDAGTFAAQAFAICLQCSNRHALLLHQRRIAQRQALAFDGASHANAAA